MESRRRRKLSTGGKRQLKPSRHDTSLVHHQQAWKSSGVVKGAILLCLCLTVGVVLTTLMVVKGIGATGKADALASDSNLVPPDPEEPLPPSYSRLHRFNKAAVCTDGIPCSKIGRDILTKGGSAMDAAIAALFCNGIVNMHSMGLGGGFMLTGYSKATNEAYSLIAREAAPSKASSEMFVGNESLAMTGGLAVGVPGELLGYWQAWQRYGRLPWADLVAPTIELCRDGYHMSHHQYSILTLRNDIVKTDPILRDLFVNPVSNDYYHPGTLILPRTICDTLRIVAAEGGEVLNNGSLTKQFVEDLKQHGSLITEEDMTNYQPEWAVPVKARLRSGHTVYSPPPPASGPLLSYILNILDGFNFTSKDLDGVDNTITTVHRVLEAYKFAFAHRTELTDPRFEDISKLLEKLGSLEFAEETRQMIDDRRTYSSGSHYGTVYYNKDTHGTAHISVIAADGDAVSVTSTINLYFGAGFTSETTGIVLNSVMDDFSVPGRVNFFGLEPSPHHFIKSGKRPLSSACPSIVVDKNNEVALAIGASGGTKITTAVSWVIMRHLWFGEDLKEAVDAPRIHHQLYPMELDYEFGNLHQVIEGLKTIGHKTKRYRGRGSIICAVSKINGTVYANSDFRKGGEVYGID